MSHKYQVGVPFNPSHYECCFHPPDLVDRQRTLKDGPKRLYRYLVRRAGRNGECFPSHARMAEDLGKSVAQVKRDCATLEKRGLVRHRFRDRRRSNTYEFLWHACFEGAQLTPQLGSKKPLEGATVNLQEAGDIPGNSSTVRSHDPGQARDELSREVTSDGLMAHGRATNLRQEFNSGNSSSSFDGRPSANETPFTHGAVDDTDVPDLRRVRASDHEILLLASFLQQFLGQATNMIGYLTRATQTDPPPEYLVLRCFDSAPGWTVRQIIEAIRINVSVSPGKPKGYAWFPIVIADIYEKRGGQPPVPFQHSRPQPEKPKEEPKVANANEAEEPWRCPQCGRSGMIGGFDTPAKWCTCDYGRRIRETKPDAVNQFNATREKLRRRFPSSFRENNVA